LKKLKRWQFILLIIFYPAGILYFIFWVLTKSKLKNSGSFNPFSNTEEFTFNVAGVTFKSGRYLRQTMLEKIKYGKHPFNGKLVYKLEGYDYKDEQAIGVWVNDWMIGNVPRDLVDFLIEHYSNILTIKSIEVVGGGTDFRTGENYTYGARVTLLMKNQ